MFNINTAVIITEYCFNFNLNNNQMLDTFNNTNIKNEKHMIKNNQTGVNTLVNMGKDDYSKPIGKARGAVTENNYNK